MTEEKNLGYRGEQLAKEYLLKKGYFFIANNYRSEHAEIDLIFRLREKIIFVEVKTRTDNIDSRSETPLSKRQTNILKRAIIDYCIKNKINFDDIRLDLILILIKKDAGRAELKHYINIL